MAEARRRTAALLFVALMATAGAFAASATFASSEAHAVGQTGNAQNQLD